VSGLRNLNKCSNSPEKTTRTSDEVLSLGEENRLRILEFRLLRKIMESK
jgi:hypothetical protein